MQPLVIFIGLFVGSLAHAHTSAVQEGADAPHLELELDSRTYRKLLEQPTTGLRLHNQVTPLADLSDLIALGKRNLDFLDHLNSKRPADQKLQLTSPALQPGYPIDAPKESSPRILRERLAQLRSEIPAELRQVLLEGAAFPDHINLDDITYLTWARRLDGIYQGASRWTLQEPYLAAYRARSTKDVRGFYALKSLPDWRDTLARWEALSETEKSLFRPSLLGICANSLQDWSVCRTEMRRAETGRTVLNFVERHWSKAQELWDSYFKLGGRRSDITWRRDQPLLAMIPFKDPRDSSVKNWLLSNIEDEWRWLGWQLRLNFQSNNTGWGTTEVRFVPGATPNVNGLGGSIITMDANQNLEEYGTRWTIRHEFGHVLGLPDCYIEFYDDTKEVMVSYQLDLDNLMCSRRGKIQQIHFDELKRAYFR
jgi:hypothetical protein